MLILSRLFFISIFFNLLLVSSLSSAEKKLDVAIPKKGNAVIVSDGMSINGVEARVWEISGPIAVDDFVHFYKKLWSVPAIKNLPGYLVDEKDQWTIVSRLTKKHLITVQLKGIAKRKTIGIFSISKLPNKNFKEKSGKDLLLPNSAVIVNDVNAVDKGKKSRTVIAVSNLSLKSAANFYRREAKRKGWVENERPFPTSFYDREAILFDKGKKELNVALVKEKNKTVIVVVQVSH